MSPKKRKGASQPRKETKQAKIAVKCSNQHALESQEFTEKQGSGYAALLGPDPDFARQPVVHQEDDNPVQERTYSIDVSESFSDRDRLNSVLDRQAAEDGIPVIKKTQPNVDTSKQLPEKKQSDTVLDTRPSEDSLDGDTVPEEDQSMDIANYFPDEDLPDLVVERKPVEVIATGRRFVNFQHVFTQMQQLATHGQRCTNGNFQPVKELRDGIASSFLYQCSSCGRRETVSMEKGGAMADINDSLVWAAMAVGISHQHVQEMFAVLEVPSMSKKKWDKHKKNVQNIVDLQNLRGARIKEPKENVAAQKRKEQSNGTGGQKKLTKSGSSSK